MLPSIQPRQFNVAITFLSWSQEFSNLSQRPSILNCERFEPRSHFKRTVLISSCSVAANLGCCFLALIPPFSSLTPFEKFFRPLQPDSSSHNWGICMRIPSSTSTLPVIYGRCSHRKQAVHTKSIDLWMSEENFHEELSRITLYKL